MIIGIDHAAVWLIEIVQIPHTGDLTHLWREFKCEFCAFIIDIFAISGEINAFSTRDFIDISELASLRIQQQSAIIIGLLPILCVTKT